MSLCSFPTNELVSSIAPGHHACILQLHLTSSHVFIRRILSACMSVTVSSYQHPCILHLLSIPHVYNRCTKPAIISFCKLVPTGMQADTLAPPSIYIFVIAISNHLCCLLHLQQTKNVVMAVTIAPGKQACTNKQSRW